MEAGARDSVAHVLQLATGRLQQAGVLNPKREATALWAAVAGLTPGDVWLRRDGAPESSVAERFWEAVDRRASGTPFPYAVGRASFRTLALKTDARALIPRPETEGLVELVLEWGNGKWGTRAGGAAADVGTGCGCIALSLAVEGTFDRIVAVERSPQAAALARENVAIVEPPVPVEVREGDLLAPLAGARYRAIVSNPPYLTAAEYDALLAGAAPLLEPGGLLAIEIDERRGEAVRALAHEFGWRRIGIHDDLFGRPRYALAFPREDA